jgi:uncharacterized protein
MFRPRRVRWRLIGAGLLVFVLPPTAWAEDAQNVVVNLAIPRAAAEALHDSLPASIHDPLEVLGLAADAEEEQIVPVRMRDGVELAATIIRPRLGDAFPTVLIRTPYRHGEEVSEPLAKQLIPRLVRAGYAIVIVSDRGTQWSQGSYHWLKGQNRDGYDILSWIARQHWSTGKVGTFGCSSSAESQPPLATLNHPAHKAVVEIAGATGVGSIPGYHDQGIFFHGGIHDLVWGWWFRYFGHQAHPVMPAGLTQEERVRVAKAYSPEPIFPIPSGVATDSPEVAALLSTLPIVDILRAVDSPNAEWDRILRFTPASPEWHEYDLIRSGDRTKVPGLHIDTWYDTLEAYPETKLFTYLSGNSPNQYLVMGPGPHCSPGSETAATNTGETDVGDGRFDYASLVMHWYDRWLKDDLHAIQAVPRVQYYVLNSNHWRSAAAWPVSGLHLSKFYFASAGHANSRLGDGELTLEPNNQAPADQFVYDPMNPVPSLGGTCCSDRVTREQSPIELRQDVLVYTSRPFEKPTQIVGDVTVTVFVSSSAPDTDLVARLVDVYPDGRAYNLTETAQRVRYRDGNDRPSLMQDGQVYRVAISGMVSAVQIGTGHRLRVQLTSSNFPNYERNMNTGGRNFDEARALVAHTRIYHDLAHPSAIELSTLEP